MIFDDEHVVKHLISIEEYFDELGDDLNEVLIYMVALLEHFEESQQENTRTMEP